MGQQAHANRSAERQDSERDWLDGLARRYSQALSRFFERRIEHKSEVPDLVQDVFLRLSRLKRPDAPEKLENYLFKTASNTLRDHFRRGSVRHVHAHEPFESGRHGGSEFSPADVLEDRQAIAALQDTLRSLPARTRDVFVLKAFEDQKTTEVACALNISTRAVEKHYAKALERITKALVSYRE